MWIHEDDFLAVTADEIQRLPSFPSNHSEEALDLHNIQQMSFIILLNAAFAKFVWNENDRWVLYALELLQTGQLKAARINVDAKTDLFELDQQCFEQREYLNRTGPSLFYVPLLTNANQWEISLATIPKEVNNLSQFYPLRDPFKRLSQYHLTNPNHTSPTRITL